MLLLSPLTFLANGPQLAFGIIPGDAPPRTHWSSHPHIQLRSEQSPEVVDLRSALSTLGAAPGVWTALDATASHSEPAHRLPAFTDIFGLWCDWPFVRGVGSISAGKIDNPFPFPLTTMGERPETRNVWRTILKKGEASLSEMRKQVLLFYDAWKQDSPLFEIDYKACDSDEYLAFFKSAFDSTTHYFRETEGLSIDQLYNNLIPRHVDVNALSLQQAEENIKIGRDKTRDITLPPRGGWDPIFVERAYIYAENVPKFVEKMERLVPSDAKFSYEDAWWMMMMRLHAWTMSVEWVDREGVKIPSEHYDNPTRVYIL